MPDLSKIRNFCIIAHIDHGKSTLADRLLERTGTITERDMKEQTLDDMDLERERGITIKSHAVRMTHDAPNGQAYTLNLIDTPGHVDFTYEVSRALKACEGAILLVDAAQGIEAQTISNLWLALEQDLEIIPVLNKVDLPVARPDEVAQSLEDLIGEPAEDILRVSAKTGEGVDEMLNMLIDRVPAPSGDPDAPLRALIFDSVYDSYRGSVVYARLFDGTLNKGDTMRFMANQKEYDAEELGILRMGRQKVETLTAGDVGYIIGSIKDIQDTRVGDTITLAQNPAEEPIPGFEEVKPMVFSGIYPTDTDDFEELRSALEKLQLNDASLTYQPESSAALGFGFRVGFLGLLHMEIIQERLEREFDLDLITTVPNVEYHVDVDDGEETETVMVDTPEDMPHYGDIEARFMALIEELAAMPRTFMRDDRYQSGAIHLDGVAVVEGLYSALYHAAAVPALPMIIAHAAEGDYRLLADWVGTPFSGDLVNAEAMALTIECGEVLAFSDPDRLSEQITAYSPYGLGADLALEWQICPAWGAESGIAADRRLVSSDIPALLLTGRYDPVTPPAWAHLAAEGLSRGTVLEFAAASHSVLMTEPCAEHAAVAFYNNPAADLGAICPDLSQPPRFILR